MYYKQVEDEQRGKSFRSVLNTVGTAILKESNGSFPALRWQ